MRASREIHLNMVVRGAGACLWESRSRRVAYCTEKPRLHGASGGAGGERLLRGQRTFNTAISLHVRVNWGADAMRSEGSAGPP